MHAIENQHDGRLWKIPYQTTGTNGPAIIEVRVGSINNGGNHEAAAEVVESAGGSRTKTLEMDASSGLVSRAGS